VITFNVIVIDYIVFCLFIIAIMHVASNRNRLHLCCNRPMSDCDASLVVWGHQRGARQQAPRHLQGSSRSPTGLF